MTQKPPLTKQGRRGFALLITIVLLAFLVLIMVSFAALTRVEIQVAKNYQQLDQARHNALTGLNIALGQLQKYAGPDKAVSARADITSTNALAQPYLTGVWRSTNTTSTPDVWLVSGNEVVPTAVTPATAPNPATGTFPVSDTNNQVYLVGTGSASSLAQGVLLTKQTIAAPSGSMSGVAGAPTTGHYAWWVGDEGIKASACLVDQNLTANPLSYNNSGALPGDDWSSASDKATIRKRNQLNQLMQPRPASEKILTTVPPAPDTTDLTSMPKLLTINQLPLLPSASGSASAITQKKSVFHDLTALSRGVLADTSTGLLRTDFSPANTGVPALDSYIKLRPDVPASNTAPYQSMFYPQAPSWNGVGTPTWPIFGVTPVMTEAALYLTFDISGGKFNLKYRLVLELWNPYSTTIKIDTSHPLKFSVAIPSSSVPPSLGIAVKQYNVAAYNAATSVEPPTTPIPTATETVLLTSSGGFVFSGTTGANTITIEPGRTLTLRGASSLDVSSNVATATFDTYASVPVSTLAATSTSIYTTIDMPAVPSGTVFKLQLPASGDVLQAQTITAGFLKTTGVVVPGPVSTSTYIAYAYTFGNSSDRYLTSHSTSSVDPRLPVFPASVTTPYSSLSSSSSPWSTAPDLNANNNSINLTKLSGAPGCFQETTSVRFSPYDLPRQELISIAELRHLMGPYAYGLGTAWASTAANQLFDQAFFSTVPQNYAWSVDGSEPRPNRYLDVYKPFGVSAASLADLRDKTNSARYQLIRGSFNINSTSIAAWKAILGSPSQTWDYAGASLPVTAASATTTLDNTFFRVPAGAKEIGGTVMKTTMPSVRSSASLVGSSGQSQGSAVGRQISDTEVTALATRIVTELQTRGKPFVSLADFIGSYKTDATIGTWSQGFLEYAINKTQSDVNAGKGLNGDYAPNGSGWYGTTAVTQADVLAKIAPFISARSDTFIIRTYGDVQNPVTAKVEARVWGEATVQRVPDLVSDATAPVATVVAPPAASNPFGRRFKIISFRWLSPNDL